MCGSLCGNSSPCEGVILLWGQDNLQDNIFAADKKGHCPARLQFPICFM